MATTDLLEKALPKAKCGVIFKDWVGLEHKCQLRVNHYQKYHYGDWVIKNPLERLRIAQKSIQTKAKI